MILAVGLASCAQVKRLPESHLGTPRHRGARVAFLGKRSVPPGVKWQSQDWSKSNLEPQTLPQSPCLPPESQCWEQGAGPEMVSSKRQQNPQGMLSCPGETRRPVTKLL